MGAQNQDIVGSGPIRADAWEKVSGQALFVDDLLVPGACFGGTVRSPVARGRIKRIVRDPAFDWSRVVLVTADDLPGPNVVAMIKDDHRILAEGDVRFVGEPVALVAAPDRETLAAALGAIAVEIEELPAVLTIEDALRGDPIIWGDDNVISEYRIRDGDPADAFARADLVVEGAYRTGHQEHLYLEPNGMIATPRPDGGIDAVGSLQCPYYVHNALARALGIPKEKLTVRQAVTGGAFGGKEDFPSVLALHASLLALRGSRPVRMIYERSEDIRCTTKRHPSLIRHRTGVLRDGTIVAAEIDLLLDGGAYATMSPVVLSRSVLHASGAYRIPNISIHGRAVATNTPPNGAFRGFGAPQSIFAIERQMDRIASELGIDPLEIRRRNALRKGDRMPCGQVLDSEVAALTVLERAAAISGYEHKRSVRDAARGSVRRGIGISLYLHGGGFTGAGEERIAGKARLRYVSQQATPPDGSIEILVSNVEMGQGASTVLSMIVAQTLGIPLECVRHGVPDTSTVPDTGPTVASRTTMIVGGILFDACNEMIAALKPAVSRWHAVREDAIEFADGSFRAGGRTLESFMSAARRFSRETGSFEAEAQYKPDPNVVWDEATYRGHAYKAYSWGADVVEVEVDTETMETRPLRATVVVEIGRAIHPILAIGQVEGGTVQALGYGYLEEMKTAGGRFVNDRVATYIIPTSLDVPEIEVAIEEQGYVRGAYGAKGLGELPFDGGAPALAAAIDDATGLSTAQIPLTPEALLTMAEEGEESEPDGRAGSTAAEPTAPKAGRHPGRILRDAPDTKRGRG